VDKETREEPTYKLGKKVKNRTRAKEEGVTWSKAAYPRKGSTDVKIREEREPAGQSARKASKNGRNKTEAEGRNGGWNIICRKEV